MAPPSRKRASPNRESLLQRHSVGSLPRSAMQRLARGRSVRRPVVTATQQILCRFVQDQVDRSVALAHHQRRRVVTVGDVGRAMRLMGGDATRCMRCDGARQRSVTAARNGRQQRKRPLRSLVDDDDLLDDPVPRATEPTPVASGPAVVDGDVGSGGDADADGEPPVAGRAAKRVRRTAERGSDAKKPRTRASEADGGIRGRDPAAGLAHALQRVEPRHLLALGKADAAVPGPVVDAYAECVRLWSRGTIRVQPLATGRRLAAWTPGDDAVSEAALRRFLLPAGGPMFLPVLDRDRCALYVTVPSADPPRLHVARIRGEAPGDGDRDAIRDCVEYLLRDEPVGPAVTGLRCPQTADAAASGLLLLLLMETAALQVPLDAWEADEPPDLRRFIPPELLRKTVLTGRRAALRRLLTQLRRERTDPGEAADRTVPVPVMTSDPALGQDAAQEEEEEEDGTTAPADSTGAEAPPQPQAEADAGAAGPDEAGAVSEGSVYAASDVNVELDDDDGPANPFLVLARPADTSLDTLKQPHEPIADAVVDAYDRFLLLTKPKLAASVYVTQTATTRRIVADALDAEDVANTRNLAENAAVRLLVLPMTTPDGAQLFVINRFPPVVIGMAFGDERNDLPDGVLAYSERFTGDRTPGTARLRTTPCAPAQAGLYMLLLVEHFVCFATRHADWALSVADIRLPNVFPRNEQKALSARLRAWLHQHLTMLVNGDVPAGGGPGAKGCYLRAATTAALDHGPHELLCGRYATNAILDAAGIPRMTTDELDAYAIRVYKNDLKQGVGWSDASIVPRRDRFYNWVALERALLDRGLTTELVGPLSGMDADAANLVGYILGNGKHYVAVVPGTGGVGWDLVDDGVRSRTAEADPARLVEAFFKSDAETIERLRRLKKPPRVMMTYRITASNPVNRRAHAPAPRRGRPPKAAGPAAAPGARTGKGKGKGPPATATHQPPPRRSSRLK